MEDCHKEETIALEGFHEGKGLPRGRNHSFERLKIVKYLDFRGWRYESRPSKPKVAILHEGCEPMEKYGEQEYVCCGISV